MQLLRAVLLSRLSYFTSVPALGDAILQSQGRGSSFAFSSRPAVQFVFGSSDLLFLIILYYLTSV